MVVLKRRGQESEKTSEDRLPRFPGHVRLFVFYSGASEEESGVLGPRSDLNTIVFEKV